MGTVRSDTIRDVSARDNGGRMQQIRRSFLVEDLSSGDLGVIGEALDHAGIPQYGSSHPRYPALVCVNREATLAEGCNNKVWIVCDFQTVDASFFNSEVGEFHISGGTGLIQKRIAYDGYGNQLTVAHTFPADDPDYPSQTIEQGAEVDVLSPQTTIILEGIIRTAYPHYISAGSTGYLNATYWAGGAPYTWMCTDVAWDLWQPPDPNAVNSSDWFTPRWKFRFEFLYEPETHIPYIIYRDERTDRPPPDLVAGVGYSSVAWYPVGDFNQLYAV